VRKTGDGSYSKRVLKYFFMYRISSGVSPVERFDQIEMHWSYFLGFGAPYVLLVKSFSFFVGYGLFLSLFPFCILLGGISDYKAAYEQQTEVPPRAPLFRYTLKLTKELLRYVNSLSFMSLNRKGAKRVKDNSSDHDKRGNSSDEKSKKAV
jgi:hypothetical protein